MRCNICRVGHAPNDAYKHTAAAHAAEEQVVNDQQHNTEEQQQASEPENVCSECGKGECVRKLSGRPDIGVAEVWFCSPDCRVALQDKRADAIEECHRQREIQLRVDRFKTLRDAASKVVGGELARNEANLLQVMMIMATQAVSEIEVG